MKILRRTSAVGTAFVPFYVVQALIRSRGIIGAQLRNRIERGVALCTGPWIGPGDLFPEQGPARCSTGERMESLSDAREAAERRQILAALEQTGGQVRLAAERLCVSRSTLFEKIRKLGLQRHARE